MRLVDLSMVALLFQQAAENIEDMSVAQDGWTLINV